MKEQEFYLQTGEKCPLLVPETAAEFDALPGGRVGLCCECGVDDVVYRGPQATVRDMLASVIAKKYPQVPRRTKPHPNQEKAKKGETVFDESPIKYLDRVASTVGGLPDDAPFQPEVDEIIAKNREVKAKIAAGTATQDEKDWFIEFSVEKVARTGGGGLIPKIDLENADTILKMDDAQRATVLGNLAAKLVDASGAPRVIALPTVTGDATATATAQQRYIALLLKE